MVHGGYQPVEEVESVLGAATARITELESRLRAAVQRTETVIGHLCWHYNTDKTSCPTCTGYLTQFYAACRDDLALIDGPPMADEPTKRPFHSLQWGYGPGLLSCDVCGALVLPADADKHEEFHAPQ